MITDDDTSTSNLISSDRVNGTEVYSTAGEHVGHIDHLVIDKVSGKIAYAMMGFGGFLGMGEEHQPIPWGALTFDPSKHGYVTDISREKLEAAPERRDDWAANRDWEEQTFAHFGAPYYWI